MSSPVRIRWSRCNPASRAHPRHRPLGARLGAHVRQIGLGQRDGLFGSRAALVNQDELHVHGVGRSAANGGLQPFEQHFGLAAERIRTSLELAKVEHLEVILHWERHVRMERMAGRRKPVPARWPRSSIGARARWGSTISQLLLVPHGGAAATVWSRPACTTSAELGPGFPFARGMRGMRVLDVGSATGLLAFEFEKRGASVVSVELPSL